MAEDQRDYVETARASAERTLALEEILRDILDFFED